MKKQAVTSVPEVVKGLKGYDKDLKCRDFQYEIGGEYETDKKPVRCTENGFHFCENPLDIFAYYDPASSRFTQVEGSGQIDRDDSDTKVAVSKIKVGIEVGLQDIIERGIKFIFERTTLTKEKTNDKEKLQASNSGTSGAASNSGESGAASNSGWSGAASNSGTSGAASNSGWGGAASNSGERGAAFTIGGYSSAETSGDNSIAVAAGYQNKAKAAIGCWIVLAERDNDGKIINLKSAKIDGNKLKPDTWYQLVRGKFITL